MVKKTDQRDEKRVIIYYTFNDEHQSQPPAPNTQSQTSEHSDHE